MASLRDGRNFHEDIERGKILIEAVHQGDFNLVASLLKSGVSVNADEYNKSLFYASKNYVTPLQIASAQGHIQSLKLLIDSGADLNARDRFDVTAVHMAAEFGHQLCLKRLLDSGADINIPTKYSKKGWYTAHPHPGGTTALHLAALHNNLDCVRDLIQFGADYNAVDEKGRTSLYIAAELGWEECVLVHLKNAIGRDILSLPSFETGDTPLHFCVMHGLVKCVEELLDHGSDVNLRNCAGYSPLDYGVLLNFETEQVAPEILKLLVLKGFNCDINSPDCAGLTPLHYVSFSDGIRFLRRPQLAAFLIAYGANVNICDQRCTSLIQTELWSPSSDLTILNAIVESLPHVPSLASLTVVKPLIRPWYHAVNGMDNLALAEEQFQLFQDGSNNNQVGPPQHVMPNETPPRNLREYHERIDRYRLLNRRARQRIVYDENVLGDRLVVGDRLEDYGGVTNRSQLQNVQDKQNWYRRICARPRMLQHYCRYTIRTAMGHKRLKHVKDLPVPTSLQEYILLDYDKKVEL